MLDEDEATEDESELDLIEELDELTLKRTENDDNDDDDEDNDDDNEDDNEERVELAVDVTELGDVVDTALLELDEVEDSVVDGTTELELLEMIVEDMLEMDELARLELDEEAAFELLEDDEPALLSVSKPAVHL